MAVSIASGISGSITSSLRVQQAQRNAERAELEARSLRASAEKAQNIADREQEKARSLSTQASQAQTEAGRARLGLSALEANERGLQNLGSRLEDVSTALPTATVTPVEPVAATESVAPAASAVPAVVVNIEGQTTGTLISVTA